MRGFWLQEVFWRYLVEEERRIGRRELARRAEVSYAMVGHYITGYHLATAEIVDRLMRSAGVQYASDVLRELQAVATRLEREVKIADDDDRRPPPSYADLPALAARGPKAKKKTEDASTVAEPELPLNAAVEKKRADREGLQPGQKRRRRKTAH